MSMTANNDQSCRRLAQRSKSLFRYAASFARRLPGLAAEIPVQGAMPRHPAARRSYMETEVHSLRQGRRWFVVGQGRLQSCSRPDILLSVSSSRCVGPIQ